MKLILSLITLLWIMPLQAQTNLFNYKPETNAYGTSTSSAITPIQINPTIKSLSQGDNILIALPNGFKTKIKITSINKVNNNDVTLAGESADGTNLVLTVGKNASYGSISNKILKYAIGHSTEKTQILIDQNVSELANINLSKDYLVPPNWKPLSNVSSDVSTPNISTGSFNSKIRVLFVYSNEYGQAVANPTTRFNQMIAFTNSAYNRSGIDINLELAGAYQINFNNAATLGTLLSKSTSGTDYFSGLHQLRNQTYADLVAVISYKSGFGTSGLAWVNGNSATYGYSAMKYPVVGSDGVFAHEIGHNLGSGHERTSSNPSQGSPCEGGYTGYSCGHGVSGGWGTIMSYLNWNQVNYVFSNPSKSCSGSPCGIPQGQSNSADNRTSFNITRSLVANFRPNPPTSTNTNIVIPPILNLLLDEN